MSRWSVTLPLKGFNRARSDVIVFFSAENRNSPWIASPALIPPTGTPRAIASLIASSTGESFQMRT